ncbi:hypothetical protein ACX0HA_04765 [Flavobacterium hauense]
MLNQFLFIVVLFFITTIGYSQKKKDTVPYTVRYTKLKDLYIKELDSKTHRTADSLFQVFAYKMTPYMSINEIDEENDSYPDWAKANIYKTEFKNATEVQKLWDEYDAANNAAVEENKEYFDCLLETIQLEGGVDMHMAIINEVREKYPLKYKRIKLPDRKKKDFNPPLPSFPKN